MVILLVSMMSPSIVCIGATWSFSHLSIARLHWRTEVSGVPMTAKIASMRAAKTYSMFSLEVASVRELSTFILAGSGTLLPWLSRTPVLIEHGIALARSGDGSQVAQEIMSRNFLCFLMRSRRCVYTTDRAWMACWNGSQLDVEAVDPKTVAVARLK